MSQSRRIAVPLLWVHLGFCLIWLAVMAQINLPQWSGHVWLLSILAVQFTWSYTAGILIGPRRKRRPLLWSCLLLAPMPLWFTWMLTRVFSMVFGPAVAAMYLAVMLLVLGAETWSGLMLGLKHHAMLDQSH